MWPLINLISLIFSFLGLAILYLISLQPKKRESKVGEKAWKQSKDLRTVGFFCEALGILNIFLWTWFPIPGLDWKITQNPSIVLIISLVLGIPCLIIMGIGVIQAGKESWEPHRETLLDQGLYRYVRHPQAVTEFPLFAIIALGINSWFLFVILTLYAIIYLPFMKSVEEKDLVRRFGDNYKEYQEETGAFFPKKQYFKRKK
ncbi:MAG: methyltransferase family protein [Promethearchaeota archaeon]